jgi:RNA polymerase sigma-70 factor (ECF subfamily)
VLQTDSEVSIYINDQSFEKLYDRYCRIVYSIALRIVHNTATAEEVTHEVFVLIRRHGARFDPSRGTLIAWITTLSRNKALDQLRLKCERQRLREDQDETALPVWVPCYETSIDIHRQMESVREVLRRLSAGQRTAIELAFFEGLTQEEIAERLATPLGAVKSWIRSGILKMKKDLLPQPTLDRPIGSDSSPPFRGRDASNRHTFRSSPSRRIQTEKQET